MFGQHGFEAASIEQIAEAARVAPATVYRHFGDKDGLVAGFLDVTSPRLRVRAIVDQPTGDLRRDLERIAETMLSHAQTDPASIRLVFIEALRGTPLLPRVRALSPFRTQHALQALIETHLPPERKAEGGIWRRPLPDSFWLWLRRSAARCAVCRRPDRAGSLCHPPLSARRTGAAAEAPCIHLMSFPWCWSFHRSVARRCLASAAGSQPRGTFRRRDSRPTRLLPNHRRLRSLPRSAARSRGAVCGHRSLRRSRCRCARRASEALRQTLGTLPIPDEVIAALKEAHARLGRDPLAVRSSATAEDLPGRASRDSKTPTSTSAARRR